MIKFDKSDTLLHKLEFLSKYSTQVTITSSTLCTKRIQIIFKNSCLMIGINQLTLKIKDLINILKYTDEVQKEDNILKFKYSNLDLEIYKKIKLYTDHFKFPVSSLLSSVTVTNIKILSTDDLLVDCDGTTLILSSSGLLDTQCISETCDIINQNISRVQVKIKSSDIKILSNFDSDMVLCFFSNYILVYILEDDVTNIIMVPILQRLE